MSSKKQRNIRKPHQFEDSKVEGYFMVSKRDALVAVANKLTGSQCRLWIYLMAIDSFADYTAGGEIKYHDLPSIPDIAVAVGSSPDTVEKDLRKLRSNGLYDYRSVVVQGHNLTAARAKAESERLSKQKSETSLKRSQGKDPAYLSSHRDYLSGDEAYLSSNEDYLSRDSAYLSRYQRLETAQSKDYNSPQTIQTYTDFRKTLSDEERESFLNFCEEKAKNLSQEVNDIEAWLAHTNKAGQKRWEVYYDLFRKSQPELVQATQNAKWENHTRREEWLTEIERTNNPLEFAGIDKEKLAFVNWCWETKQFIWLQEEESNE